MTVRQAIADAANTVEGIDAHPYFERGIDTGHTMVRLDHIEYPNRFGGIVYWNVVVVIPQDMVEAEHYIEDTIPLVRDAVAEHIVIDDVTPRALNIQDISDLLCVFINGHREEEESE